MNQNRERRQSHSRPDPHMDIRIELTILWFRKLLPTIVLASLGMVGGSAMLAWHFDDPWLWKLTGIMIFVCSARIAVVSGFMFWGSRQLTLDSAARWQNLDVAGNFSFCVVVAMVTVHDFRYHDATAKLICTVGSLALCAGMIARLGMTPWKLYLNGSIVMTALTYSMASEQDPQARAGALLLCFFAYAFYESVETKFDILTEQLRGRRKLRELAEQDTLTGLANRRLFRERLTELCTQGQQIAVLYIDLDRFKAVNDTFGHATGDALLKQVAARLCDSIRSTDLLARLGGDEFAIVQCPSATESTAQGLAERINHLIAQSFEIDGHQVSIGASVGIQLSGDSDNSPDRLLSNADGALYRVKQAGRGGYSFGEL